MRILSCKYAGTYVYVVAEDGDRERIVLLGPYNSSLIPTPDISFASSMLKEINSSASISRRMGLPFAEVDLAIDEFLAAEDEKRNVPLQ